VELDPESADFRVIELLVPERLEAHLIVETIDEGTTYDPETGEMVEPQDPEIDPAKFAEYRDQIDEQDVTPGDFGRIAAQTAKQVILQRIREAKRDMMFEEYRYQRPAAHELRKLGLLSAPQSCYTTHVRTVLLYNARATEHVRPSWPMSESSEVHGPIVGQTEAVAELMTRWLPQRGCSFGFHGPAPLIALIYLCCSQLTINPPLR
jgi:hypothetical protein